MNGAVTTAVIISSLLLAAWCGVTALRNRTIQLPHLAGAAAVEVMLVVQVVVAVVASAGGDRASDAVTFIGYLVTSLALLPVGAALALVERTRWGSVVLAVTCLVVPVVELRLQQVWQATGA